MSTQELTKSDENDAGVSPSKEPLYDSNKQDQPDTKKPKKKKGNKGAICCRKCVKFLFSHVGLTLLVLGYCVAGGFIFQHLEILNEKTECDNAEEDYQKAENATVELLWDLASQVGDPDDQNEKDTISASMKAKLQDFAVSVLDTGHDSQSKCSDIQDEERSWSFPSSLLFAITIVTTIGYGHIAPASDWGRLVCIAYSTLGIPLCLLCLANIGDVMADIFRYVYKNVCCCGCCKRKNKNKIRAIKTAPSATWELDENGKPVKPALGGVTIIDDDDDDDEEEDEDKKVTVPLTVTLIVVAGYILGGGVLFSVWEGWPGLASSYFCFITLTTIGFGDYYPETDYATASAKVELFFTALYVLFGLSLVAMAINLMVDEMIAKVTWLGEKIGFVKNEDDDDDDDDEVEEEVQKK